MGLHIVCGRAHSGKSRYITDTIKNTESSGGKVVLVVPEQFTHAAETRILKAIGKIRDDYMEITSFKRLAARTRAALGNAGTKVISPVGKSLIMSRILEGMELDYYKSSCDTPGFVNTCLDAVSELKKYGISPNDMDNMLGECPDESLRLKLSDLRRIYADYDDNIHNMYVDSDDTLDILAKDLEAAQLYSETTFFFDEFSTFIPQEREIISRLIGCSKEVYVTLCMDKRSDTSVFLPCETTYNQLCDICTENGFKRFPTVWLGGCHYASAELEYIEKNLFSYPTRVYGEGYKNVSVLRAKTPYCEVENAAASILSLVRDEGYRYRDICVICADINGYEHIFKNVFKEYSLPFFIDEKTPVLNHHLVLFVLNILDVYIDGYSYESIFNFLKSGFLDLKAADIALLENFILKTNISKNSWLDDNRWNSLIEFYKTGSKEDKKKIADIREKYILPLAEFHDRIKGRHPAADDLKEMYAYLCSISLDKTVAKYVDDFRSKGDVRRAKEYETIWNIIISSLDETADVFFDMSVTVERLRRYLYIAFASRNIGIIPTALDEIFIGDIARTRIDDAKVLYILGANEGLFPIPARGDVILTDRDKKILSQNGTELPYTSDIQAFINQFLIYTAFTSANERLFVSYSIAGNEYSTLAPAFSVGRLKKMFPGVEKMDLSEGIDDISCVDSSGITAQRLVTAASLRKSGKKCPDFWNAVYSYYEEHEPEFVDRMNGYFALRNNYPVISSENMAAHLGDNMYTTISRMQKYSACHYSYFLAYMLKLREKQLSDLQNVDIGSIAHEIIERICADMKNEGISFRSIPEGYFLKKIDNCIRGYISDLGYAHSELTKRQLYSVERLRNVLLLCFDTIRTQICESSFNPVAYEVTFDDDNIGCIEITLDDGKSLKLTGKIDRVDVFETEDRRYVRVIDYKTGKKTFNLNDVINGIDIQLLVYLNALVDSDAKNAYGGAFFFLLDDVIIDAKHDMSDEEISKKIKTATKLKGIVVDSETVLNAFDPYTVNRNENKASVNQFAALGRYLKQKIKEMWISLEGGDMEIRPYLKSADISPCNYCPYISVCRFDGSKSEGSYNVIKKLNNKEIWKLINGGESDVDEGAE